MDHIGIDLGGRESQVWVRTGEGVILEERGGRRGRSVGGWRHGPQPGRSWRPALKRFGWPASAQQHGHDVRVAYAGR